MMFGAGFGAGLGAGPAAAFDVPSGAQLDLSEVLLERVSGEEFLRFRFVAPHIATPDDDLFDTVYADAIALCDGFVQEYIDAHDVAPDVIVISMMDRFVPFGQSDPTVTQFFEAFRHDGASCRWDDYQ